MVYHSAALLCGYPQGARAGACALWGLRRFNETLEEFLPLKDLGMTSTADYYGINDLQEAKDYLKDSYLGGNLIEISKALLDLDENDPSRIFGYPDDLKLRSSMTLFMMAAEAEAKETFRAVLDKFYGGIADGLTEELLAR